MSAAGKSALRSEMRALRRRLARETPDAAVLAAQRFNEISPWRPRVAAAYHPHGSELDPGPLAVMLRQLGAQVVLPIAVAADAPLVFRQPVDGAPLPRDAAGVPAPGLDAPALTPDLVVVPLLAFDGVGARLGQGGGYYDRTLAALRARGSVVALGLAYVGQEVERLPAEAHDQRLDAVLTEAGLRRFAPI